MIGMCCCVDTLHSKNTVVDRTVAGIVASSVMLVRCVKSCSVDFCCDFRVEMDFLNYVFVLKNRKHVGNILIKFHQNNRKVIYF